MIRHLIVVTFRSFTRNKSSFLINLLSLSAGLVGVLLIMLWINDELQKDKFYANDNLLFQVVNQWKEDDQINTSYFTHGPLAAAIKEEIPEVKAAANVVHWFDKFNISVNEKSFSENGFYVGKEFFDVFGFKLKIGNVKGVFQKPNSVAISEKLAIKYFQNPENAIGKTIKLENQKELTISSVFANLPQWSTLQFDFLMSFEDFVAQPQNAHRNKWETTGPYTMLTLTKGADKQQVANKIKHVVQSHFKEPLELRVVLKPFSEVYLYGQYDKTGTLVGGRIQYVKLFGIIGVFLLLISCFNFISLSVAQATKRIKEVGIKKNLGASRLELAIQYFFESSFLCFLALMSALGVVYLFLPTFSRFTEKNLDGLLSIETIGVLTGLIGIMSLMAGAYPAFYLSSFKPLKILKGDILPGKGGEGIRKILVVTQFAISVTLMIGVTVVYQQIAFVQNTNLGYKKDNLVQVILNLENRDQITAFIEEVKQLSGVINISSGNTPINHQNRTSEISWKGKDENRETAFYFYGAHFDLLETLGIQIKEGRDFSRNFGNEANKVLINETAAKEMGFNQPLGKTISLMGKDNLQIIGVIKDFHFQTLYEPIRPLVVRFMEKPSPLLVAKLKAGSEKGTLEGMKTLYNQFNPNVAFDYEFLDEQYNRLYTSEQKVSTLASFFAITSIIISCLGLLGLVIFMVIKKRKEIIIRRIHGASVPQVVQLLTKEFLYLVGTGILISFPVSYFFSKKWLDSFVYHVDLQWIVFVLVGFFSIAIAFLTVGYHAYKAAHTNPAESLKIE